MKARDWIREAKAKKKSKGHGHSTLHQGNCQPPILPVSDYGFSAANRSRAIGLPNHFQYEGLVHPITLHLCAAKDWDVCWVAEEVWIWETKPGMWPYIKARMWRRSLYLIKRVPSNDYK